MERREALRNSVHQPNNIYNVYENGVFCLLLHDNSFGFTRQSHYGVQQPKSRIMLLVGADVNGTDKLALFIIGKSQNAHAFKNITMPVEYHMNKRTWMASVLHKKWLRDLDQQMRCEKGKVAMIINNCPAHPNVELTNGELLFLPPIN